MERSEKSRSTSGGGERVHAIDFTKGALVVFMVIYHSLNYSTNYRLGFKFLAFLPPSFIFITGFIIARVYFRRPPGMDGATGARMLVRGLKLLAIFTLLNIGVIFISPGYYMGEPLTVSLFFAHWQKVYLTGAGGMGAFEILVPISYVLILGPLLLWLHRRQDWLVPVLAGIVILYLAYRESLGRDVFSTAAMMTAGLLGAALGTIPQRMLDALGRFWFVPIAAYGIYALSTHSTNIVEQSTVIQVAAAALAVAALYGVGARFRKPELMFERVVVLGNYSLLAYIAQIGILQIIVRYAGRPEPFSLNFLAFFIAVLLLTTFVAEITHWCRAQNRLADHAYRFVFA